MSKFQKILLGVFCGGILLCGIGAGVAFTEFSSLTYGGEKLLGEGEFVTKEIDVEIAQAETPVEVYGSFYYNSYGTQEIELDENVPEDTIRFRAVYKEEWAIPDVYADLEHEIPIVEFYWNWQKQDEVRLFMEAKDKILADLKEGKISSYDTQSIQSVEVLVNPASADRVHLGG